MASEFDNPATLGVDETTVRKLLVSSVAAATVTFSMSSDTPPTSDFGPQVVVVSEIDHGVVSDPRVDPPSDPADSLFEGSDALYQKLDELRARRGTMSAGAYRAERQRLVEALSDAHRRIAGVLSAAFRSSLPLDLDEVEQALDAADGLLAQVRNPRG